MEVTDLRFTPENIIMDSEQWNENGGDVSDDIYRVLMDDGTAFDFFYTDSMMVQGEFGRIFPMGGRNACQLSIRNARLQEIGDFLRVEDFAINAQLDIDCKQVISIGAVGYDMSLFGRDPRTIQ